MRSLYTHFLELMMRAIARAGSIFVRGTIWEVINQTTASTTSPNKRPARHKQNARKARRK